MRRIPGGGCTMASRPKEVHIIAADKTICLLDDHASMMLVVQPSLCLFDRANVLFLVAPKQAPPPPPYFAIALAAPRPPRPPRPPPPFNCSQTLERSACQIDAFSALSDTPSISLLPQHIFGEFGTRGPLHVLAGQRPFIRTDGRLPICRTDPPCPLGGGAPHPPSSRPKWTSLAHEGGRGGFFCMIIPPPDRGRVGELESALRIHPRSFVGIFHLIWALCAVSPRASVNS